MAQRPGRVDRNALVGDIMGRRGGGGGGGAGIAQALQQFMQSFGQSLNKMTQQVGKAQQEQSQSAQQQMANIANVAEQSYNQAQRKSEQQHQEARQDAATQDAREYQLQSADYQRALEENVARDAKSVALIIQQQEAAKSRIIQDRERNVATIADARSAAWKWVTEDMDKNNKWDLLGEKGLELREDMLKSIRVSGAINEDYQNSPYADRLFAQVAETQRAVLNGETDFQDFTGTHPQAPLVPVPESMIHAKDLDLPTFTSEEIQEWENRNGYPKGGLWAMKTDDPKTVMVNPVGFSALMAAKQQDSFLAVTSAKEAQREFLLGKAKSYKQWKDRADPQEELQVRLVKEFNTVVPDAFAGTFRPAPVTQAIPGAASSISPVGADTDSLLRSLYGSILKNPELVDRAMSMSLPEGDPKRWVPGMSGDPAESAKDEPDMWKIKAAETAVSLYLENAHGSAPIRANIAAWLGGLSEQQVWQVGLSDDVAQSLVNLKRMGPGAKMGGFFGGITGAGATASTGARKMLYRAESQVIANLSIAHRDRISDPINNNPILHTWKDNNHAVEFLQDGTAMAVLSRMEPEELKSAAAAGVIPQGIVDEHNTNPGLFRTSVSVTKGAVMLNSRPGARSAIHEYVQGGLPEEVDKVISNPLYNKSRSFYEYTANNGIGYNSVNAPSNGSSKPRPRSASALIELLHTDRASSRALMDVPPEQVGQQTPGPSAPRPTTNAPQPVRPSPAVPQGGQPAQPSPQIGQMGQEQEPFGQALQLTPPMEMGAPLMGQ